MDVDAMMIDGFNGGDWGCKECGKIVCSGCAVNRVGEGRRCLTCAGKEGINGGSDRKGGGRNWGLGWWLGRGVV